PRLPGRPRRRRPAAHEPEEPAVLARGRRGARRAPRGGGPGRRRGRAARRLDRQPDRLPPDRPEGVAGGEPAAGRVRAEAVEIVGSGQWTVGRTIRGRASWFRARVRAIMALLP